MSEQDIHEAIAAFLDAALPPGSWHSAIDPAAKSSKTAGALLKARGGKKGIPDHIVLVRGFPTIFFEVKTATGKVRIEQNNVRDAIWGAGSVWWCVRSIDDVEAVLRQFGVPLRASVGRVAA